MKSKQKTTVISSSNDNSTLGNRILGPKIALIKR